MGVGGFPGTYAITEDSIVSNQFNKGFIVVFTANMDNAKRYANNNGYDKILDLKGMREVLDVESFKPAISDRNTPVIDQMTRVFAGSNALTVNLTKLNGCAVVLPLEEAVIRSFVEVALERENTINSFYPGLDDITGEFGTGTLFLSKKIIYLIDDTRCFVLRDKTAASNSVQSY